MNALFDPPRETPVPCLTYSEAERLGVMMFGNWIALTGEAPPWFQGHQLWADMVQSVLRKAAMIEGERASLDVGSGV